MEKHSVLNRQLRRCNLTEKDCPTDLEQWQQFLVRINRAYNDLDQERYLLERLQEISSREMNELYQELEDKQTRLQAIFDNVNEGIVITDEEGTINALNTKAALMFGYDTNELIGKNFDILITHYDKISEAKLINLSSVEVYGLKCDGNKFPAELSTTEIQIKQHPIIVGIIRDISERKRAQEKEKKLNEELVTTARLAGMADVATSILHNVGNILNSLGVSITLLKEKLTNPKVLKSILKLNNIVNQYNGDFAKYLISSAGQLFPEYIKVLEETIKSERDNVIDEISSLTNNIQHIKEVIAMQQSLAGHVLGMLERTHLSKQLDMAIRIVGFGSPYTIKRSYKVKEAVILDKIKLMQILVNLIRNAKDSLLEKNNLEEKKITLTTERKKSKIQIKVIDNGIGILPKNITKIFSFGFTTKRTGHGYGLHTSILLAKEMGGTLKAESKGLNQGAIFTLELPYNPFEGKKNG